MIIYITQTYVLSVICSITIAKRWTSFSHGEGGAQNVSLKKRRGGEGGGGGGQKRFGLRFSHFVVPQNKK